MIFQHQWIKEIQIINICYMKMIKKKVDISVKIKDFYDFLEK